MKSKILLYVFVSLFFSFRLSAQTRLAAWTFDATAASPNTPTSITANVGSQSGTATLYANGANGSSLWSVASPAELTAFGGTLTNDPRESALAGQALALVGSSANGKSIVISFSTTGYKDPVLSFATRGTATGFTTHAWAWSTDGLAFTPFGGNTAETTSTFTTKTLDLTAIDAVDNMPMVYLQLTVTGASATSGNNRLDNIVVNATAIPATPVFSVDYPRISSISPTGFEAKVSLNQTGTAYLVVLPRGTASPTSAQVKAGEDGAGNTVESNLKVTIPITNATAEITTPVDGLSPLTDYDVYFVAENEASIQDTPVKLEITTLDDADAIPPAFTASYPAIEFVTYSGFTLATNISEPGKTYFVVVAKGAPTPSALQVKMGQDANGTAVNSGFSGTITNESADEEFTSLVGVLNSGTPYDIYVVAEDNIPNLQSTPTKLTVVTTLLYAESFNSCEGTASFIQYSVTGDQVWACNDFGYNNSKGLRMNGFSGSAIANEDWLISPALNLNADAALSFYSQFSFAGNGLQLKISTDYSGSGNPATATWTDLNGGFPTVAVGSTSVSLSDWTLSNVTLSAYAGQKVFIAFVYTSTSAAAARWTLDEIKVSDAVPSYLSVTPSALQFVSAATTKSYSLKGVNLQEGVTLTAPANFYLSKDNSTFVNTVSFTAAEAALGQTVYVRFDVAGYTTESFSGIIAHTSVGVSPKEIAVKGTDKSQTLDIVTYNLEFFGTDVKNASNVEFGPTDDALQVANVTTVMQTLGADIFAVEEIADDNAFNQLVTNLEGYDKIVSDRWSYSFNPPEADFPPQKIGFIYNTSTVHVVSSRVMFAEMYDAIRAGTVTLPSYPGGSSSFWSSGRLPFMVTFDVTIKGVKKRIRMIDIHAKSGSAQEDYDRRKYDVQVLHDSLAVHYPTDNIILLGDFNDDVDSSIAAGEESSYKPFVDDVANYNVLTYPLSQTGAGSFPSSNSFLDHIILSTELTSAYVANSTTVEDARNFISNYVNTTSDHLPVSTRLLLTKTNQSITFAPLPDKVFGDPSFTLTAAASSSLPVTFTTTSDKVTLSGNQLTMVKAGRVTISAGQEGNDDFNAASPVSQSFCIRPAKPVVTVTTTSDLLTSSASSGNQWYLNGAAIEGAVNATYTATSAGTYKVQVKADDCVSDFSNDVPVVITAIEPSVSAGIYIYPNPVQNELMISGLHAAASEIYLIDITGRSTVLQLTHQDDANAKADVSELTAGLYLARISDGTRSVQIKFLKK